MALHRTITRSLGRRRVSRGRVMAILAGGAVLGLGTTATLAAWTDTEWVFGGVDGTDPGMGTSSFEVQQDVTSPYDATNTTYSDNESNPGQGLIFGVGALSLTPGDSVYAPVALRTVKDSVAGTLALEPAVSVTGKPLFSNNALAELLDVTVWTSSAAITCQADPTVGSTVALVRQGKLDSSGTILPAVTPKQALSAGVAGEPGAPQFYCFKISLPTGTADRAQGLTVSPAWEFSAVSN